MREESHLEEMRSAIRGDFERLAERRGEQELLRVVDASPRPDADQSQTSAITVEPEPEPEPEPTPDQGAHPEDGEPRRSWLTRFLSP